MVCHYVLLLSKRSLFSLMEGVVESQIGQGTRMFLLIILGLMVVVALGRLDVVNFEAGVLLFLIWLVILSWYRRNGLPYKEIKDVIF